MEVDRGVRKGGSKVVDAGTGGIQLAQVVAGQDAAVDLLSLIHI